MPRRFFRRRFGRSFQRGFREPRVWERSTQTLTSVNGALLAAAVFSPTGLVAAATDQRLTLRRLILTTGIVENVASAQANVDLLCGVAIYTTNAPNPSPLMATPRDTDTDWLDLWNCPIRRSGALVTQYISWPGRVRDIRTMRKVDNVDQVAVTMIPVNPINHVVLADGSYSLSWEFSALFSRTSR